MSFHECVRRAVAAGKVKQKKADEALSRYEEVRQDNLMKGLDGEEADRLASAHATKLLEHDVARRRIVASRNVKVTERILEDLSSSKDWNRAALDLWEKSPHMNYAARKKTIEGVAHGLFEKALSRYAPKAAGLYRPVRGLDNLLRELFGIKTADAAAGEMAAAWKETSDFLYNRAKAAGADIAKREDWRLPNSHDPARLMKDSREEWSTFIEPLLDWDVMQREGMADLFGQDRRLSVLREVRDTLVQDGQNKVVPSLQATGRGSLASRMGAHRFLVFKDADGWLTYHARYGSGSVFDVMTSHIESMAHEISLLETFGPNPAATKEWLKGVLTKKASELDTKSGGRTNITAATKAGVVFDRIYNTVTGTNNILRDTAMAQALSGTRDILSSALLGSAFVNAITGDLFTKTHWRIAARLPMAKHALSYVKLMSPFSKEDHALAVRSGFTFESAVHASASAMRWFGSATGQNVTRRISDVVMRASLLNRHTEVLRWAHMSEFTALMADEAGKNFDRLTPGLQTLFKKYGITPSAWDLLRQKEKTAHGPVRMLLPNSLRTTDATADGLFANATADRFMDMIFTERDNAIMATSLEARAALTGAGQSGTFIGEVVNSVAMFKNFPVTVMMLHMRRMLERQTMGGRLAYAGTFVAGMALMGALAYQIRQVAQGKDPVPMFGDKWMQFWGQSALQGGGLGILGDFLFKDVNRFGGGLAETLSGPVASFASDSLKLTVGNALEVAQNKDTHAARELVGYTRRYLPGANLWWARLALQRGLFDWMQEQVDPEAAARFAKQVRDARRDYGQEFWWTPGEETPSRAPDVASAFQP